MKIEKNKWVSIHYTLKDENGQVIDSSVGKEPLDYIHGNGYLIPGLENELLGKEEGDKFSSVIAPKDGYGEYDESMILEIPRNQFEMEGEITEGMQFQAMSPMGPMIVTVTEVKPDTIKVDGNHALAGKTLYFDIEVLTVRDATEDELNPKGCGGCGGCGGDCSDGGCGGCGGDCGCN